REKAPSRMSVYTPKRVALALAVFLAASSSFASDPSPRNLSRMAFDVKNHVGVLFGGQSSLDTGTQLPYSSDETWLWTGGGWVERFPSHRPPGRSGHAMVYDAA